MAYIGAVAPGYDPTRASVPQLDAERFSGNSSTTAFTLTRKVVSPTDIEVIVENVQQEPTTAYTVDGYTLNFTEAPSTGTNNIYVIYRNSGTSNYAYVPDGSITYAKLANNIRQFTVDTFTANGSGSTVVLSETPASANTLVVTVDGVMQSAPENYTLSGTTLTFTSVPDNGANIVIKHLGFRTTATVQALQAGSVTTTELADGSVTNPKIVSVANTKITGNIISSQIAPSVTLTTPTISGNLNLDSTGTTGIRLPSANTIAFHTAGTEDMRIDANGNVGLGTTTPAAKIAIFGGTNQRGQINFGNTAEDGAAPLLGSLNNESPAAAVFGWGLYDSNSTGNLVLYRRNDSTTGVKTAEWNRGNGNFSFDSGYGTAAVAYGCRAWVNFDGTSNSIRASGNVSSITDHGTGDYTLNFATAMPDANYSVGGYCMSGFGGGSAYVILGNAYAPATGSCRVGVGDISTGARDVAYVMFQVFR